MEECRRASGSGHGVDMTMSSLGHRVHRVLVISCGIRSVRIALHRLFIQLSPTGSLRHVFSKAAYLDLLVQGFNIFIEREDVRTALKFELLLGG